MTEKETLVLVDGSALAFRSFYALLTSGLRNREGTPTWAVYGFLQSLFDLLEKQAPDMIAVCFDLAAPTFRHVQFESYKANRAEMPDELAVQWPLIKQAIQLLNIPVYELEGFEADDVIGTVAKKAEERAMRVLILTGDQDAFQLLDGGIQVLMPGKGGLTAYGRQEVFAKLGVWPEQVPDYKGLVGDASDNIPGVRGIGPKTAVQLLSQFKTIEGTYEHLDDISSSSVKQKLQDGRESAFASKDLATIRSDISLDFDFDRCRLEMPDVQAMAEFLQVLEFKTILSRLPKILAPFNKGVAPDMDSIWLSQKVQPPSTIGQKAIGRNEGAMPGPVAVQERIPGMSELTSAVASVGALRPPLLVYRQEQLAELIVQLGREQVFALSLAGDRAMFSASEIVGLGFAWLPGAKVVDGRVAAQTTAAQVMGAYIPLKHFGEAQMSATDVLEALSQVFNDRSIGKASHNLKSKLNALHTAGAGLTNVICDSLLASHIVNPDDKHSLSDQASRIFNYQLPTIAELAGSGKKALPLTALPALKVAPYIVDEARLELELARHYGCLLDEDQLYLLREMELPLSYVLARMEQSGVAIDLRYLKHLSVKLADDLLRLEQEIHRLAGKGFNINSPQQLAKVLFDDLKLPVKGKTKSGYSTDAAVLEQLAGEHEIIGSLLEYRQLSKLRSTYVEALPKMVSPEDGRIHGEFNQAATATGRLSSSNPNLQNIPIRTELGRSIRAAFVPGSADGLILSADYSQIELRMLAHMSGDETLLDAFTNDQDIHARTAMEIFDVPIDKVDSNMRRVGKTMNFALVYQQGAYATAQSLGVSTKEAQAFIDRYFSRYPKVRAFRDATISDARRDGFVRTLWGRKRYFKNLHDRNDNVRKAEERQACNAPLQGSAADLMKLAMINLDRRLNEQRLSAKIVLQVHDELVLEVPAQEVEATRRTVLDAMQMDNLLKVPLKVDIGIGKNWLEAK